MSTIPVWVVVALVAAAARSGYMALQKHLTDTFDSLTLAFYTCMFSLPVVGTVLAGHSLTSTDTAPLLPTGTTFWLVTVAGLLNLAAMATFLHALSLDDMSVVSPLRQTTPLFVGIAEPILLTIAYDPLVIAGAGLAVVGSAVMVSTPDHLHPSTLTARLTHPGPIYAILAAILFAGTSLVIRITTFSLSPVALTFYIYLIMGVGLGGVVLRRPATSPTTIAQTIRARWRILAGLGVISAARTLLIFVAFALTAATNVSITLQASLIVTVLIGVFVFNEDHLLFRMGGGVLVTLGIIAVVTA